MSFRVDVSAFNEGIRRLSILNNKTQGENLLGFARTTLRNSQGTGIVDMTPPASPGKTNAAARMQGEAAIDRDLRRVFAPVKLKNKGVEQHPNPKAIHRRLFRHKRPGVPLRSDRGKEKYWIDVAKYRALAVALKKTVGKLAASWAPSCRALNVNLPPWVARHGNAPGAVRINLTAPRYFVQMDAYPHSRAPVNELRRRVGIALGYTQERLKRAISGTVAASAKRIGFKAA